MNVLVPHGVAPGSQVRMRIETPEGPSQTLGVRIADAQPNVVTVLTFDGSVNGSANPARQGSKVSIIVSGGKLLDREIPDGTIGGLESAAPVLPIRVDLIWTASGPHGPRPGVVTILPEYAGTHPVAVVNLLRIDVTVPPLPSLALRPYLVAVRAGDTLSPTFPVPVY